MKKTLLWGLSLALALAWLGAGSAGPARAASFIVNSTNDTVDANIGDGNCETATPGECTLRAAIQEANAAGGGDAIILPAATFAFAAPLTGSGEDAAATGDLDLTSNVTISGASPATTTIDGALLSDRVFHVLNGNVTISNLTISHGDPGPGANGGGLLVANGSLTLSNVVVDSNTAEAGGGLYVTGGSVTINFSTISNNTASVAGGGGIGVAAGSAVVNNSTFDTNHASGLSAGAGGAMYVAGGAQGRLNNSTVFGNTAAGLDITAGGGGIFAGGNVQLNSVTVAGNIGPGDIGNGIVQLGGSVNIRNTLIANNGLTATSPDCSGTLNSQGYNLLRVGTGCNGLFNNVNGDKVGVDPNLAATPANNGGPTQTLAITLPSEAIDAGNPGGCGDGSSNFSTDQRGPGFSRYQNSRCDIGAFEYIYLPSDPPTNTPTHTPVPSATSTPTTTPSPAPTGTPLPSATNTLPPAGTATLTPSATPAPKLPLFTSLPPTVDFGPAQTAQMQLALTGAVLTAAAAVPSATPDGAGTATAFAAANASPSATATASATPTAAPTIVMPAEDAVLAVSDSAGRAGGRFVCGLWMLEAPTGAVPEGSQFRCNTVASDETYVPALPAGVRGFWQTTDIRITGSNGSTIDSFTQSLRLCAYYSDVYRAAVGSDPARFTIYTASSGGEWQALSTSPDASVNRVCAAVDHFSLFRLAGQPGPAAGAGGVVGWLGSGVVGYAALAFGLLLLIVVVVVVIAIMRRRKPKEAQM